MVSLALQVAVNYANDYSDGIRGTDDARVGPMRLVGLAGRRAGGGQARGFPRLRRRRRRRAGARRDDRLVAGRGGAGERVAAWYYTGGSTPYGYLGLGEVMVFVFFGLVAVVGTTYVQTESWESAPALYAAVGIGALACAILVANNLRDIPTDTVAGKRTLAVRLGDARTRRALPAAGAGGRGRRGRRGRRDHVVGAGRPGLPGRAPAGLRTVLGGASGPGLIPVLQQTGVAELALGGAGRRPARGRGLTAAPGRFPAVRPSPARRA